MNNQLSPTINGNVANLDKQLIKEMREIAHSRWAEKTRIAYQKAVKDFAIFCKDHKMDFLPAEPETVLLYLTFLARHAKWSTIKQRMAAIVAVHNVKKLPSPIDDSVKEYLQAVKRKVGEKVDQKRALLTDDVKKILELTGSDVKGLRDRALILFAFSTWLRAENLTLLEFEDISWLTDGIEIRIRKEKQDQTGKGREIPVKYGQNPETCPVIALKNWLFAAGIISGRVFRSVDRHENVNGSISYTGILKMLKHYALMAGFDPKKIGCHSTRAGGATQAIIKGMPFDAAQDYGNWKSANTFKGYIRRGNKINAMEYLGL